MNYRTVVYAVVVLIFSVHVPVAFAGGVEEHAPIGVMGDHIHKTGEWMVSYRYMKMDMETHLNGTDDLTVAQVHSDFPLAPIEMTMEMHMLGAMYALNNELTFMIMIPYIYQEMDHVRRSDGAQFNARAQGIGDIRVSGLVKLKEFDGHNKVHLNIGVSAPTGSINIRDDTLAGNNQKLPYPMQLGSGTVDLLPGVTYVGKKAKWSWGAQANSTVRFGRNRHKYRLGNRYDVTSWVSYTWEDWISTSFRVNSSIWKNVRDADPALNPNMVQTADPNRQGGERIDLLFGVNLIGTGDFLNDHRLALEVGFPIYQNLDGPQLGTDLQWTVGWQKAF